MLFELFVFGSFWFYLLLAVAATLLLIAMDKESGALATTTVILLALALLLFGTVNVFKWIWLNPWTALMIFGIYLVGGVIWAFVKWATWLRNAADRFEDVKQKFLEWHNISEEKMTKDLYTRWEEGPRRDFVISIGNTNRDVIPKVHRHKAKFITWMTYWPFSFVWTFVEDGLKRFWQAALALMSEKLQQIADHMFANKDFKVVEIPEEKQV